MKSYSLEQLRACLSEVGVRTGDLVMVHSSLLALGRLEDCTMGDVPAAVADGLLDCLGPEGTLVAPAFNFGFCRGEPFDRQNTPSDKMGLLSEHIRRLPGARRSTHPMQSVAAMGPLAEDICGSDTPSAFDRGGAFDRLIELDCRLLLLGASLQAASVIHHAEQHVGVPYRYWKDFTGEFIDGGRRETRTYRMYVRDLDLDPKLVMTAIEEELNAMGRLRRISLGSGRVRSCTFRDLLAAACECLRRDPTCLVAETKA